MWAYIYEHPDADPTADRFVLDRSGERSAMVPVPEAAVAPDVARRLVEEGVELIELCGGFSLIDAARVVDAVGDQVPVGHVTFSVETVRRAADYVAAFEAEHESDRLAGGGGSV